MSDENQARKLEKKIAATAKPAKEKCATPDQIKFYDGEIRDLLDIALFGMRVYLVSRNAYPAAIKQRQLAKKIFRNACKMKFGSNWRGSVLFLFWSFHR